MRHEATTLEELKITEEPLPWLARFLGLIGQVAGEHNCAEILTNLLPNQNRVLKSPASLLWDKGIKRELKDIALAVGRDVRDRLLLAELVGSCQDAASPNLKKILIAQVTQTLDEVAVFRECIEELNRQLPDNRPIAAEKSKYSRASVDLLKFLWERQGVDAAQMAQQCPLVASDNSAIRWTVQRQALVPVSVWLASAQPFAKLYESDRILSEDYVTRAAGTRTLVDALVKWGMAFADPLCIDTPRELRDERLEAIAVKGENCTNVTVADISLSQIAHLPNQLIQRCQTDENLARMLLGLTLRHLAVHDSSWRDAREVPAKRDRTDIKIRIFPAAWLADLRSKAWVPARGEKDGQQSSSRWSLMLAT